MHKQNGFRFQTIFGNHLRTKDLDKVPVFSVDTFRKTMKA
jgi:hypothetical protein